MFEDELKLYFIQEYVFSAMGVDIIESRGSRLIDKPLRFLLIHIGILVSLMAQYRYIVENFKEILKVADGLFLFVAGVMVFLKGLVFLWKRNEIVRIMQKLNKMSEEVCEAKERAVWTSLNRREQIISLIYFVISWAVTIFAFVPCGLNLILKFILKHENIELTPPVTGIYFYDNSKAGFFILTCLCNALFMFHLANCEIGVDMTFSWFVHNIMVHFRILRLRIECTSNDIAAAQNCNSDELELKLKTLLVYHRQVLNFVNEFDEVYCMNIFIQVLYSSMQLMICAFLLTFATDLVTIAVMIVVINSLVLQIIFYCIGGQTIQNECEAMAETLYLCTPWHHLNRRFSRHLLFTLMRSQRTVTCRGYFFIADNKLLVTIYQATSSFLAVFRELKVSQDEGME